MLSGTSLGGENAAVYEAEFRARVKASPDAFRTRLAGHPQNEFYARQAAHGLDGGAGTHRYIEPVRRGKPCEVEACHPWFADAVAHPSHRPTDAAGVVVLRDVLWQRACTNARSGSQPEQWLQKCVNGLSALQWLEIAAACHYIVANKTFWLDATTREDELADFDAAAAGMRRVGKLLSFDDADENKSYALRWFQSYWRGGPGRRVLLAVAAGDVDVLCKLKNVNFTAAWMDANHGELYLTPLAVLIGAGTCLDAPTVQRGTLPVRFPTAVDRMELVCHMVQRQGADVLLTDAALWVAAQQPTAAVLAFFVEHHAKLGQLLDFASVPHMPAALGLYLHADPDGWYSASRRRAFVTAHAPVVRAQTAAELRRYRSALRESMCESIEGERASQLASFLLAIAKPLLERNRVVVNEVTEHVATKQAWLPCDWVRVATALSQPDTTTLSERLSAALLSSPFVRRVMLYLNDEAPREWRWSACDDAANGGGGGGARAAPPPPPTRLVLDTLVKLLPKDHWRAEEWLLKGDLVLNPTSAKNVERKETGNEEEEAAAGGVQGKTSSRATARKRRRKRRRRQTKSSLDSESCSGEDEQKQERPARRADINTSPSSSSSTSSSADASPVLTVATTTTPSATAAASGEEEDRDLELASELVREEAYYLALQHLQLLLHACRHAYKGLHSDADAKTHNLLKITWSRASRALATLHALHAFVPRVPGTEYELPRGPGGETREPCGWIGRMPQLVEQHLDPFGGTVARRGSIAHLLHWTAAAGHVDTAKYLLEAMDVSPNVVSAGGHVPLVWRLLHDDDSDPRSLAMYHLFQRHAPVDPVAHYRPLYDCACLPNLNSKCAAMWNDAMLVLPAATTTTTTKSPATSTRASGLVRSYYTWRNEHLSRSTCFRTGEAGHTPLSLAIAKNEAVALAMLLDLPIPPRDGTLIAGYERPAQSQYVRGQRYLPRKFRMLPSTERRANAEASRWRGQGVVHLHTCGQVTDTTSLLGLIWLHEREALLDAPQIKTMIGLRQQCYGHARAQTEVAWAVSGATIMVSLFLVCALLTAEAPPGHPRATPLNATQWAQAHGVHALVAAINLVLAAFPCSVSQWVRQVLVLFAMVGWFRSFEITATFALLFSTWFLYDALRLQAQLYWGTGFLFTRVHPSTWIALHKLTLTMTPLLYLVLAMMDFYLWPNSVEGRGPMSTLLVVGCYLANVVLRIDLLAAAYLPLDGAKLERPWRMVEVEALEQQTQEHRRATTRACARCESKR